MSICYIEEKSQFRLHTKNTSYIIEILDGKFPMHVYWGDRLNDMPSIVEWDSGYSGNLPVCDMTCYPFVSSGIMPSEFPCFGTGDMREPAFHAIYKDGSRIASLEYEYYKIIKGKNKLEGLPASYGTEDEVSSLEIYLYDKHTGLSVCLQYSVFEEKDAITRSVLLKNKGDSSIEIKKIASMSLDFYDADFEVLHLHGDWAREFQIERSPLTYGIVHYDSKCGKSSHYQNPTMVLVRPETIETTGESYGVSLVYSGNFDMSIEKNCRDYVRIISGINNFDFSWELKCDASFQSPEVVMVYSKEGLGGMSRKYHRFYRENLCRGNAKRERRPILINNWEATYCNFTEEKLLDIAEKSKQYGIEMLVLDDGWFGDRNSDEGYLGDWVCNYKKLPDGLDGLGNKLKGIGMKFGIWMEPEMVSINSDLYRAHPDWCIHVENRKRNLARNQLVLDLSRKEVCD